MSAKGILAPKGRKYGGVGKNTGTTDSSKHMQVKLKEQIEIDIDRFNKDNYEKEKRIMLKALIPNLAGPDITDIEDLKDVPDLEKMLTTEEYNMVKNHLAIINQGRLGALKPKPGILGPSGFSRNSNRSIGKRFNLKGKTQISKSPILKNSLKLGKFADPNSLQIMDKI
jgi:hypothetical protein